MSSSERYRTYQREYQRKLRADPVKREEMNARKRRLRQDKREQYEAARIAYESRPDVKERRREQQRKRLSDPEKRAQHQKRNREWASRNPEKVKQCLDDWESRNREYRLQYHKTNYWAKRESQLIKMKRWREQNRDHKTALERERTARKMKATPPWYDRNICQVVYAKAADYGFHVDHIVPLTSPIVCGLHCWDNLQLLSPSENISKRNRQWPDMPMEAI